MDNIGDVIERATLMAGSLDPGQGIEDYQRLRGLQALNSMLATWVNEGIPIYHDILISFDTVPTTSPYSISADATVAPDILTAFPIMKLTKAWYRQNNDDTQIKIIGYSEYDDLADKSWVFGDLPEMLYYEQDLSSSAKTGSIYLYPISSSIVTVFLRVIYSYENVPGSAVDPFSVVVPTDFVQAYTYNLAVELANNNPGFVLSPTVMGMAAREKSKLYRLCPPKKPMVNEFPAKRRRIW